MDSVGREFGRDSAGRFFCSSWHWPRSPRNMHLEAGLVWRFQDGHTTCRVPWQRRQEKPGRCWDSWLKHLLVASSAWQSWGSWTFYKVAGSTPRASIPRELLSPCLKNHKTLFTPYSLWWKQRHALLDSREKCKDFATLFVSTTGWKE